MGLLVNDLQTQFCRNPMSAYLSLANLVHLKQDGQLEASFLAHLSKEDKDAKCQPIASLHLRLPLADPRQLNVDDVWNALKARFENPVDVLEE